MTFLDMLLVIEQRGEKIITDKINHLQTDKHAYTRTSDGWEEKEMPNDYVPPPVKISKPMEMPIKEKKAR